MTPIEVESILLAIRQHMLAPAPSDAPALNLMSDDDTRRTQFVAGEIAGAAACYLLESLRVGNRDLKDRIESMVQTLWPFALDYHKFLTNRKAMVMEAIGLLLCEYDRLDNLPVEQQTRDAPTFGHADTFGKYVDDTIARKVADAREAATVEMQEFVDAYVEVFGPMDASVRGIQHMRSAVAHCSEVIQAAADKRQRATDRAALEIKDRDERDALFQKISPLHARRNIPFAVPPGIFVSPPGPVPDLMLDTTTRIGSAPPTDVGILPLANPDGSLNMGINLKPGQQVVRSEGIDKVVG